MDELEQKDNIYDAFDETKTSLRGFGISNLVRIFDMLADNSNTIIIEHNLDIIPHTNWIIDFDSNAGRDN